MRIKSYFAPSVQAAIALAHKEFGHDVTLITSHVASLENRHFGEYEVVFAIEESLPTAEPVPVSEPLSPPAPPFHELLNQAIQAPIPMHQDLPAKLEQIRTSLVALGLESSLVRAFMTLLEAATPTVSAITAAAVPAEPAAAPESSEVPAPVPFLSLFAAPSPQPPRFSAAELAFMSSVSSPKEQE